MNELDQMAEVEEVEAVGVAEVDEPEVSEEVVEVDSPPAKQWSDDDEAEARTFGWVPADEWQGSIPKNHINDPRGFMAKLFKQKPIRLMQERMEEHERKLKAMTEAALDRQRRDYEGQMQQIVEQQRAAASEADTDAFDRLEQQRQEMLKQRPDVESKPQGPDPRVQEYRQSNDWAQDPVLWNEAVQAVDVGLKMGLVSSDDPGEQIKFAEERMFMKYPHLRPKQETRAPQSQRVDGGGLASGPARKTGAFEKLPSEAKDAFKMFVAQKVFKDTKEDRESYANEYNGS